MMTVITEITIEEGQESKWDEAFHERFRDAPHQPGWMGVELLIPTGQLNRRVVVGTWRSTADWEAWHSTDTFLRTRETMDTVQQTSGPERWFEVVYRAAGQE